MNAAHWLLASVLSLILGLTSAPGPARAQSVGVEVLGALAAEGRVRVLIALESPRDPALTLQARRSSVQATQGAVLARVGPGDLEVVHRYQSVPAVAGIVSQQGLAALLADPDVKRVDLDAPGSGELAASVPLIRADLLQDVYGLTGAGVTVAVLDSGMDPNHPDLAGALVAEQCFCSGGGGCCPGGGTTQSGPGAAWDDHYHGTHVSGIIAGGGSAASVGVAPGAQVVAIKVLDRNNSFCCSSDVVAGLDWILANRPDVGVVNMSLGTFETFAGDCDEATAFTMAFADVIDRLTDDGVAVFAASGNTSNANSMKAPGCVANAISVGASSKTDAIADFSGGGPTLDLLAPGVSIRAARKGGGVRALSGTSMSSPHAAGLAALLLEAQPRLLPARLLSALAETGVPLLDPRNGLTFPRIDAEAALLSLELCDDGIDNDEDGLVDALDPDCPPVEIDIRPWRAPNFVRPFGRGVVAVALFGLEDLDGHDVDLASLAFGPDGAPPRHDLTDPGALARHLRDVDADGLTDLVTHYRVAEAGIGPEDTEACLSGTIGVEAFRACDEVIPLCPRQPVSPWQRGGWGRHPRPRFTPCRDPGRP